MNSNAIIQDTSLVLMPCSRNATVSQQEPVLERASVSSLETAAEVYRNSQVPTHYALSADCKCNPPHGGNQTIPCHLDRGSSQSYSWVMLGSDHGRGCACHGRLTWPGESPVSFSHARTPSQPCKQWTTSQNHRRTLMIQVILQKAWPDGVVAAYIVWDDVTRVQILVRPWFHFCSL